MNTRRIRHGLLGALCAALSPLALAQTDAGALLRQSEPRPAELPGRAPVLTAPGSPAAAPAAAGPRFELQSIVPEGNTLLSREELDAVVAPWLGQRVGLAELQQAAAAVQQAYADRGWLVQAYLPRQDVSSGRVTLRIVEARFGGVRLEGEPGRFDPARARAIVEAAQPPGAMFNQRALDRGLMLVDDLPGVSMSASLQPGEREGDTALALRLSDTPTFSGDLGADNAGGRATGTGRLYATLRLDGPLGRGEQFSSTLLHTQGNDYLRLGASLPVGVQGWRLGANVSALRYELTQADFNALQSRGRSSTAGVDASYPIVRARDRNLYLQLSAERRQFSNEANGQRVSRYHVDAGTLGLSGNLFDGTGGSTGAALALGLGRVNLNGSPNQAADAASVGTAGGYARLRYSLSRLQPLNGWLAGYAALAGQFADGNLDSSERLYLGGPQGVRAYPVNEGGGSAGSLLNLELRATLAPQWQLIGFYDRGQVRVNVDNRQVGASPNHYVLQGAGATLVWRGPQASELRLTWARRLGHNPNATSTGQDQDGSHQRNRLWLQAAIAF